MCKRGDWFQTRPTSSGTRRGRNPFCKQYTKPLSSKPPGTYISTLPPSHFFGPVHEVRMFLDYTAVSVPRWEDPKDENLVWVNVKKGDTQFAR